MQFGSLVIFYQYSPTHHDDSCKSHQIM